VARLRDVGHRAARIGALTDDADGTIVLGG
jgi:hypothetical protein